MARHQEREQRVSEEEFERFPERITAHFDRVREALDRARESDGEE